METKKFDLVPELKDLIGAPSPGVAESVFGGSLAGVSDLTEDWSKAIGMDSLSAGSNQFQDIAVGLKELGRDVMGASQSHEIASQLTKEVNRLKPPVQPAVLTQMDAMYGSLKKQTEQFKNLYTTAMALNEVMRPHLKMMERMKPAFALTKAAQAHVGALNMDKNIFVGNTVAARMTALNMPTGMLKVNDLVKMSAASSPLGMIDMSKLTANSALMGHIDPKMFEHYKRMNSTVGLLKPQLSAIHTFGITSKNGLLSDNWKTLKNTLLGSDLILKQMRDMGAMTQSLQSVVGISDGWSLNSVIQDQIELTEKLNELVPELAPVMDSELEEITQPALFFQLDCCCRIHKLSFATIEEKLQDLLNYYAGSMESVPKPFRGTLLRVRHRLRICQEIVEQYWPKPMSSFSNNTSTVLIVREVLALQNDIRDIFLLATDTEDKLFKNLND